jgi:DNA-directed RNA polymerase beta' subunit
MALELFKPFVISWLIRGDEYAHNIKSSATRLIEAGDALSFGMRLMKLSKNKYVLLNRAPSLAPSINPSIPCLNSIEGKAIQLHPLVC